MEKTLSQIKNVQELDYLWKISLSQFLAQGFERVYYSLFQRGNAGLPTAIFSHGVDEDFAQSYADLGFARNDPVIRHAFSSGNPFNTSDLPDLIPLSREEKKVFRTIQDMGGANVTVLPVFGPDSLNGVFGLYGTNLPSEVESRNFEQIHAVAQAIHLQAARLIPREAPSQPNPLSVRETEILQWVAQGKSNGVISDIMGISVSTVDTYLRRVFDKLEVADRTMAAVKGVSMGLIRFV